MDFAGVDMEENIDFISGPALLIQFRDSPSV